MKRLITIIAFVALCVGARAQAGGGVEFSKEWELFSFSLNANRLEAGLTIGQTGSFTDYARFGIGASVLYNGFYLDFCNADPQHKYTRSISDTKWNDNASFCINAGYQVPILSWLRIMPLLGYAQTNDGITDGTTMLVDYDPDYSGSLYHPYKVTPGSRSHYFNYGGGISVQPCKWFSINAIATRRAIYGGISLNLMAVARHGE